jgi:hypothetical protein
VAAAAVFEKRALVQRWLREAMKWNASRLRIFLLCFYADYFRIIKTSQQMRGGP